MKIINEKMTKTNRQMTFGNDIWKDKMAGQEKVSGSRIRVSLDVQMGYNNSI